ncbi:MAG: hypothetical protein ACK5TH_23800 [Prosthecobacter sp.]
MRATLLLLILLVTSLPAQQPRPVAISGKAGLRSGTMLREKREILVEKGTATLQQASGEKRSVSTRWLLRHNLMRRVQGTGAEEIEVREHTFEETQFALNGPAPASQETRGALNGVTLLARQRGGGWNFDLKDRKPVERQNAAILDLQFFANVMEIVPAALGTQTRRPGEMWKPVIPAPRGKAYGLPVFKDVEATFGSIEERDDGPHAKLFISGSFTMEQPMNTVSRLEITFAIALTRRLSDLLDVETEIKGTYKDSIQTRLDDGKTGFMFHDYPYVVKRTISIEK